MGSRAVRLILPAICLCGSAIFAYLFFCNLQSNGALVLSPEKIDLGTVDMHSVHQGDFILHNDTDDEYVVTDIRPDCSCYQVDMFPRTVKSGDVSRVKVIWRVASSRGFHRTGAYLLLKSSRNDDMAQLRTELRAVVRGDYEIDPATISFDTQVSDEIVATIHPLDDRKVKLLDVRSSSEAISAAVLPGGGSFSVRFSKEKWTGAMSRVPTLSILSTSVNEPNCSIAIDLR